MVSVLESVSKSPPMTVAMLEVLDHDDRVDPQSACDALGFDQLTSLDQMLELVFAA